jgi:hypothetical protein
MVMATTPKVVMKGGERKNEKRVATSRPKADEERPDDPRSRPAIRGGVTGSKRRDEGGTDGKLVLGEPRPVDTLS